MSRLRNCIRVLLCVAGPSYPLRQQGISVIVSRGEGFNPRRPGEGFILQRRISDRRYAVALLTKEGHLKMPLTAVCYNNYGDLRCVTCRPTRSMTRLAWWRSGILASWTAHPKRLSIGL